MCSARKYPYSPSQRAIGNSEGVGGLKSQEKESMKLNWNSQRGGLRSGGGGGEEFESENPPWGRVGFGYFLEQHNEMLLLNI